MRGCTCVTISGIRALAEACEALELVYTVVTSVRVDELVKLTRQLRDYDGPKFEVAEYGLVRRKKRERERRSDN